MLPDKANMDLMQTQQISQTIYPNVLVQFIEAYLTEIKQKTTDITSRYYTVQQHD